MGIQNWARGGRMIIIDYTLSLHVICVYIVLYAIRGIQFYSYFMGASIVFVC